MGLHRGGFEPVETISDLRTALAFVRDLCDEQRKRFHIPRSSQGTNVYRIETNVMDEPSGHAFAAWVVAAVD